MISLLIPRLMEHLSPGCPQSQRLLGAVSVNKARCSAGLYKQLSELQGLVAEYREDPASSGALAAPIVDSLQKAGLDRDCPFQPSADSPVRDLTVDNAGELPTDEFGAYVAQLNSYLQEVGNRLFSEGLHQLGQAPGPSEQKAYLDAYLDGRLPDDDVVRIAEAPLEDLEAVRLELERRFAQHSRSGHAFCETKRGRGQAKYEVAVGACNSNRTEFHHVLVKLIYLITARPCPLTGLASSQVCRITHDLQWKRCGR
jgi:cobalamin biosynthesis Mg chelatase CobN